MGVLQRRALTTALRRVERMVRALRSARALLTRERREQFECFTMPPHANTPENYAAMNCSERAAIRGFDRVIAKINEAIR